MPRTARAAAALTREGRYARVHVRCRSYRRDNRDMQLRLSDVSDSSMRGVFTRIHDATRFDGILLHEAAVWRSMVAWWGEGCVGTLTAL
eukprot:COSAG02_NODE_795_length_17133_cov_6.577727_23_plen_89_part_00